MTTTMHRAYPKGWDLGYCVVHDDGDPYVPFNSRQARAAATDEAAEAERVTGVPMEVFPYRNARESGWAYRPAFVGGDS